MGFVGSERMERFLKRLLKRFRFEDMVIPLGVLATDLATGESVVFEGKGEVTVPIRASCSYPGLFQPVRYGAQLLVDALRALADGTLAHHPPPPGGTYYPWPSPDDFTISTAWLARRAFNFMRGTSEWGQSYAVEVSGERLFLKSAVSYASGETLDEPYTRAGSDVFIRFTPGVLRAQLG